MMSGCKPTSSCASARIRSMSPPPQRRSMRTLRPSVQPKSARSRRGPARAALARIDQRIWAQAQKTGALAAFNSEYRRLRLEAASRGRSFMSYQQAQARLRQALLREGRNGRLETTAYRELIPSAPLPAVICQEDEIISSRYPPISRSRCPLTWQFRYVSRLERWRSSNSTHG
jgi:hypothetical protein